MKKIVKHRSQFSCSSCVLISKHDFKLCIIFKNFSPVNTQSCEALLSGDVHYLDR